MSEREEEILKFMIDDANLSIYVAEDEDDLLMVILKMDNHIQRMRKALTKVKSAVKDI